MKIYEVDIDGVGSGLFKTRELAEYFIEKMNYQREASINRLSIVTSEEEIDRYISFREEESE